jgi:hypothetical protein
MARASLDEFFVQLTKKEARLACKNAIAQLGWSITIDSAGKIECGIEGEDVPFPWPVEISVVLSFAQHKTKIEMSGVIREYNKKETKGLDIPPNYLNDQMGRFKNLIEAAATQIPLSNDLEKLTDLHSKGILSDDEFRSAKERILK